MINWIIYHWHSAIADDSLSHPYYQNRQRVWSICSLHTARDKHQTQLLSIIAIKYPQITINVRECPYSCSRNAQNCVYIFVSNLVCGYDKVNLVQQLQYNFELWIIIHTLICDRNRCIWLGHRLCSSSRKRFEFAILMRPQCRLHTHTHSIDKRMQHASPQRTVTERQAVDWVINMHVHIHSIHNMRNRKSAY